MLVDVAGVWLARHTLFATENASIYCNSLKIEYKWKKTAVQQHETARCKS